MYKAVTETGVQLLATQKPVKRLNWWKGKLALFWMPATQGRGRVDTYPEAISPPPMTISGQELLQLDGGVSM